MGGMGIAAAQKAVEQSQKRGGGGGGNYLSNIYWKDDRDKDGEHYKKIVRFLTDDIITCKMYNFIKGGEDGKFSRDFIAVDSVKGITNDKGEPVFASLKDEADYFVSNGVLLTNFQKQLVPAEKVQAKRTVGLAVIREEVTEVVDGKARLVVRDKQFERKWTDDNGKEQTETGLLYGVITQAHKNFWATLIGYANRYGGTLIDRDYEVTVTGNGGDRLFTIVPLDKDPELSTQEQIDKAYSPPMTLTEWVEDRAKYDNIAEWVKSAPLAKADGGSTVSNPAKNKAAEPDERTQDANTEVKAPVSDTAQSLRDELNSYRP
jgi:hypothetical protein